MTCDVDLVRVEVLLPAGELGPGLGGPEVEALVEAQCMAWGMAGSKAGVPVHVSWDGPADWAGMAATGSPPFGEVVQVAAGEPTPPGTELALGVRVALDCLPLDPAKGWDLPHMVDLGATFGVSFVGPLVPHDAEPFESLRDPGLADSPLSVSVLGPGESPLGPGLHCHYLSTGEGSAHLGHRIGFPCAGPVRKSAVGELVSQTTGHAPFCRIIGWTCCSRATLAGRSPAPSRMALAMMAALASGYGPDPEGHIGATL